MLINSVNLFVTIEQDVGIDIDEKKSTVIIKKISSVAELLIVFDFQINHVTCRYTITVNVNFFQFSCTSNRRNKKKLLRTYLTAGYLSPPTCSRSVAYCVWAWLIL